MPTRHALHLPTAPTQLPAHERAARARRAAAAHLPGIPARPAPAPSTPERPGGRKTIDANYPNRRH